MNLKKPNNFALTYNNLQVRSQHNFLVCLAHSTGSLRAVMYCSRRGSALPAQLARGGKIVLNNYSLFRYLCNLF